MLHIKMFIDNAVQEIIKINKNGEFAGHVQIKLPWIPEVPGCSIVAKCIAVGGTFSQLFEVEPKHYVVKMGITCQDLTKTIAEYPRIGILASDWMRKTTGCLTEPEVPFCRFSRGLWNPR